MLGYPITYLMLKISIRNKEDNVLNELKQLNRLQIKSKDYYPGYDLWFENRFMPAYLLDESDVISLRDKKYNTLLGFCLLKVGDENKICNLSPLVDGVGITQVLLDSSIHYFNTDYTINVPLLGGTVKLHQKLKQLGFEILSTGLSVDQTTQVTYIKPKNLTWI
jgi:hypothetical protein